MAKKSQAPKPPRPVPKARPAERTPSERRTWTVLLAIAALGVIGVAVAIGVLVFGGGSSAAATIRDAGCTLTTVQALPSAQHVQEPPDPSTYNTSPPTSGPHHPNPAPFGVYDEPVEQYRLVHNLEHGGVTIQYGDDVPQESVNRLLEWYRDDPNGIVIAPLPSLGDQIALAAWNADVSTTGETSNERGIVAKCGSVDAAAFDAFMDEYAFKGPERFTEDMLAPGN